MTKHIVLFMTDHLRIDHVGYAPDAKLATPHIDRLAESMAFTNCQSVNPLCMPARTALMTGKYPHQIGTLTMSGDLALDHPTYMQALQGAGYHVSSVGKLHFFQGWDWFGKHKGGYNHTDIEDTLKAYGMDDVWEASGKCIVTRHHCDWAEQMQQAGVLDDYLTHQKACKGGGFDLSHRNDEVRPWPLDEAHYVDIATANVAIERIKNRPKGKSLYLFCSFCGPHPPYDPPQRFLDAVPYEEVDDFVGDEELTDKQKKHLWKLRHAFKAMVMCIDEQIGRVWQCLEDEGLIDDTVMMLTSDHGEMLGDHGKLQKGYPQWQSLGIPFAIRHPDHLRGMINHSPVELTDLTATILDIAGLNADESLSKTWPSYHDKVPCRSVLPILRGETDHIRDMAFSESDTKWHDADGTKPFHWHALTTELHKYIVYYDKNADQYGYKEEWLIDRIADPNETDNLAGDPAHADILERFRDHLAYLHFQTPPAQTGHVPLSKPFR